MSTLGDLFAAFRQVVTLDDRVTRLQSDLDAIKSDANRLDSRVSRLEGMFEMAMYQEKRRIDRD